MEQVTRGIVRTHRIGSVGRWQNLLALMDMEVDRLREIDIDRLRLRLSDNEPLTDILPLADRDWLRISL